MNSKKIIGYGLVIISTVAIGIAWKYYKNLSSPAHPIALEVLGSDAGLTVNNSRWITITPEDGKIETALIFYPGGLLDIEGYAEPFIEIARQGYLVVLVKMPLNLAVLAPSRAKAVIKSIPNVKRWVIGGHSLGGAMAAQFAFENSALLDGLLLFDAYPPKEVDLKSFPAPVGLIHRADRNGNLPENYPEYLKNMPEDLLYYPVMGGTHLNFGRFIPARRFQGQTSPSVKVEDQFEKIITATCAFLSIVESVN